MARVNPFARFLKCETLLHTQCVSYLNTQLNKLTYHHSPNEGKRSAFERYILSLAGVSKGFPDITIYWNNMRPPLAIELKWGTNVPSYEQEVWLKRLDGWVCWSLDAFIKIVEGYADYTKPFPDYVKLKNYSVLLTDELPTRIKKIITKQCGEEVWKRK